jgi:hypothetical protein
LLLACRSTLPLYTVTCTYFSQYDFTTEPLGLAFLGMRMSEDLKRAARQLQRGGTGSAACAIYRFDGRHSAARIHPPAATATLSSHSQCVLMP